VDGVSDEMRGDISKWLRQMKQFKFVAHLIVMCDVHEANMGFSKLMQSDELLIIDLPSSMELFKTRLEKLKTTIGKEATRRLNSLESGKLVMVHGRAEELEQVTFTRLLPCSRRVDDDSHAIDATISLSKTSPSRWRGGDENDYRWRGPPIDFRAARRSTARRRTKNACYK